jgi:FkbM family methyltransferase
MSDIGAQTGAEQFRGEFLQDLYARLYQVVDDNFDYVRFNYDGVDRSDKLNIKGNAANLDFILGHLESFFAASLLFSDRASRELYLQLLKYRCLGHPHLKISQDLGWSQVKQMFDRVSRLEAGDSELGFCGMFGPLKHYEDVPAGDGVVAIEAWPANIVADLGRDRHRQYYFDRDGVRIGPEAGDWIIDGGACFGDTAVFFAHSAGPQGRVFAFEPLPGHIDIIARNIDQNGLEDRVFIVPNGIGEQTNRVQAIAPELEGIRNPGFSLATVTESVPVISIDDFLESQGIDRFDFLKLDIEGLELAALKGAARSIERYRPRLAISLYHKLQDFYEIPLYLKSMFPCYRLYLDHYTIHYEETVLYAVADR